MVTAALNSHRVGPSETGPLSVTDILGVVVTVQGQDEKTLGYSSLTMECRQRRRENETMSLSSPR